MEHNYERLSIWKKSIVLVKNIYRITKTFPADERFNLISQMRRCAVSIPSNIAEGSGKNSNKHFSHFIKISTSSLYELQTQLIISQDLEYISEEEFKNIRLDLREISKMLYTFNKKILKNN